MRVLVVPADRFGCGYHRLIWPAEVLRGQGHDVEVVEPGGLRMSLVMRGEEVVEVRLDESFDAVVMQRVTHAYTSQAIGVLRRQGRTVVVDVDDDLSSIHPANPAFRWLHPRSRRPTTEGGEPNMHNWHHLARACRDASLVTVTTPALLRRYAAHGRGLVLDNYLADHYYGIERADSDVVGWPAAIHSHPDDPSVVGSAVARLVAEGARFRAYGERGALFAAFGIAGEHADRVDTPEPVVDLLEWPRAVAEIGVGIAPLADTRFNGAKSRLKAIEMAAAGVPWVGSPRAEYRRLHDLGCGVLVDRPKDWYSRLRKLIDEPSRRQALSQAGRAVAEGLRLRDHAWRWAEAWDHARMLDRQLVRR